MWKDSVEIKVIRLEGFPCSSTELALYLYSDDVLHDQLLPITEEKSLILSQDTTYKLEIINQTTQEEKSVSFKRDLFQEDGVHWLPLFSQSNDFLSELSEDVMLPRILLIFYRKKKLSPIEEHNSIEETETKEAEIADKDKNDQENELKSFEDEKIIQDYKKALEFERKIRDEQEKNMKKMEKELKDAIDRSLKREDSLLQLITVKEQELIDAQNEISKLRSQIRKLEYENAQVNDLLESYKSEKECLNYDGLRKELEVFTYYFRDCEEVSKIKAKLEAFESKEEALHEQEILLLDAIKGRGTDIKKENEFVYSIGGKRISITNCDGCLFYRTLGALQKLDDFFNTKQERSMTPTSKVLRRNVSDLKTLESESKELTPKRVNTSFNLRRPAFKH